MGRLSYLSEFIEDVLERSYVLECLFNEYFAEYIFVWLKNFFSYSDRNAANHFFFHCLFLHKLVFDWCDELTISNILMRYMRKPGIKDSNNATGYTDTTSKQLRFKSKHISYILGICHIFQSFSYVLKSN